MRLVVFSVLSSVLLWGQDSAPKARQAYVKAMAKEGPQGIAKLLPYAEDPVVEVRREVIRSLVTIGGPGSVEPLTKALADADEEVQIRATDGLVNFYLPGYWESGLSGNLKRAGSRLMSRWTDTNDQVIPPHVLVRPEIVAGLARVTSGGASLAARANAARALGVLRASAASDALVGALASKDGKLIYEILIAFEKIRDRSVAPKLHYLLRDLDEKVQLAALETVGLLMNPESVPFLREAYERGRNDRVRRAALNALAQIPSADSIPIFSAQLDSADEFLRAAAAEGLARAGHTASAGPLAERFAAETKMRPRLALAFGVVKLGQNGLGEFDPLRYLLNTLNSKAWKGVAEGYLVELVRSEPTRKAIESSLPQASKAEKMVTAGILARAGSRDSEATLESLSRDPDTEIANEALRALRLLKAQNP
jgi:HEAT repeat protein